MACRLSLLSLLLSLICVKGKLIIYITFHSKQVSFKQLVSGAAAPGACTYLNISYSFVCSGAVNYQYFLPSGKTSG